MLEDFLAIYIKDYIEDSDTTYDIKNNEIEDIACDIANNDYIYEVINEVINQELWKYEDKEEEENE